MGSVVSEYLSIKRAKFKLLFGIMAVIAVLAAIAILLVALVTSPIWIPGMLVDAGHPVLGVMAFFALMFLSGGYLLWTHSDLRKAYNRASSNDTKSVSPGDSDE